MITAEILTSEDDNSEQIFTLYTISHNDIQPRSLVVHDMKTAVTLADYADEVSLNGRLLSREAITEYMIS